MTIQLIQERIPARYREISLEEASRAIREAREALGSDVLILCHHYQRHEIFEHADRTGDSFKLARQAADRPDARWIVFCGVHFMAEAADVLTGPDQIVILPDLTAGCSMADMADELDVEQCWEDLNEIVGPDVVPVTYMNSSAALKAFCGEEGGAVCTSSNADAVLRWAWEQKPKVLFFPDEHLGRNTAVRLGVPEEEMAVWDYTRPLGGLTGEEIRRARILLWRGHCSVHMKFDPEHVHRAREMFPGIRILVHPECRREVVDLADEVGSTEFILKTVRESRKGTHWAVGTELHLVDRLAREVKPEGKTVSSLNPSACLCSTMYRVDAPHLLWVLESLREGKVVNRITVDEPVARWARVALDRMLSIT
jgi:quinolinate synthase